MEEFKVWFNKYIRSGTVAFVLFLMTATSSQAQFPVIVFEKRLPANSFLGLNVLGIGDQNEDGYDDFLVQNASYFEMYYGDVSMRSYQEPNWKIYTFANGRSTVFAKHLGDINGDGVDDFVIEFSGNEVYEHPYAVFYGRYREASDTIPDAWLTTIPYEVRDFNLDGINDIFTYEANGIVPRHQKFFILPGSENGILPDPIWELTFDEDESYMNYITFGDVNGDGYTDMLYQTIINHTDGGFTYVYFGNESIFNELPDISRRYMTERFYQRDPNRFFEFEKYYTHCKIYPDLNGDGCDDIHITYLDTLALDTIYIEKELGGWDLLINVNGNYVNNVLFGSPNFEIKFPPLEQNFVSPRYYEDEFVGDINGDGFNDLIGLSRVTLGSRHFDGLSKYRYLDVDNRSRSLSYFNWVGDVNGDGIDDFIYSKSAYDEDHLLVIAGNRELMVDVLLEIEELIPNSFGISSVYPNPFNNCTTINYFVGNAITANVSVYDLNGRLISKLVNEIVSAGSHSVTFDASSFTAGIYFVKLTAGQQSQAQKIVLLE